MLNFPLPYPEELLYSIVARAGIRHGIASPKQLLEEVYDNRKVVATLDFPSHLQKMVKWLPSSYALETIAYGHTLLPLYAPFIPEERRQQCLQWMAGESQGAIHLAMGVAASIVKTPSHIRYCPGCLKEQQRSFGEYFWLREWQVSGVESCDKHGMLINTSITRPLIERHHYQAASPEKCPLFPQKTSCKNSLLILEQIRQLLREGPEKSPSFEQWSCYYNLLAQKFGFIRGKAQIDHLAIYDEVLETWSADFLNRHGLLLCSGDEVESFWLRSIFRKHRKVFSYLQHLVIHEALLPKGWCISEVFKSVRETSTKKSNVQISVKFSGDHFELTQDQQQWMKILEDYYPKAARRINAALYARLYRYDRFWLMGVNSEKQLAERQERKYRVDWQKRDKEYLKRLKNIIHFLNSSQTGPRRSRNFLMKRLGSSSSLEKNMHLLPETARLLEKISESVDQYQIRRLSNTNAVLKDIYDQPPRWRVLRNSGLSEERLTSSARKYLKRLEAGKDEFQRDRKQQSH